MLPAFGALTSLTGGGNLTPSANSRSGDASAGLDAAFQYNSAFQVGGSGSQSQDAGQGIGGPSSQTLLYIGLAVGVGALLIGLYSIAKK